MGWGGANNVPLRLHTHFDTTCLKFTCPCIVSSCYACLRNSVSPCFCIPFFANKCQETERVNKAGTVIVRMLRRKKKKHHYPILHALLFNPTPGVDQGGIEEGGGGTKDTKPPTPTKVKVACRASGELR